MKLWTGRLSGEIDHWATQLNNSLWIDHRMAKEDVIGSMAWAKAIFNVGLITKIEFEQIISGLEQINSLFETDTFVFEPSDEDIHTAVERKLTELIGDTAGKLHTGRSRNDQVATDFRLWVKTAIQLLIQWIEDLQHTIIQRAVTDIETIIPGYTHLQQAQPILLSHWWMSHFWSLQRDKTRFNHLFTEVSSMPLGSAALAGTGFPINRHQLAEDLGFSSPAPNSLDSVSDRDFAVEFLFATSLLATHLSRMAEMMILFCTQEFNLITLSDHFSTGSSIMPQKKNPDPLELIRGKSGVLLGKLCGLMTTLKGLPSAYDKDLQEDKQPVFESFDTLEILLKVMNGLLSSLSVNTKRGLELIHPAMMATDLADELVQLGVPFRQAHHAVAGVVKTAELLQLPLDQLPLSEWQKVNPLFEAWVFRILDPCQSIHRHQAWGGTAPKAVQEQIRHARKFLAS